MEAKEIIYEGKAKKIYSTDDQNIVIQFFKDDATAFNGKKSDIIKEKGVINNYISAHIMQVLSSRGIENHFIKQLNNFSQLIHKLEILPLEVIVRNIAAGSICKRLGLEMGSKFSKPILEFCYKNDDLGDPMINESHIELLNIATHKEIEFVKSQAFKINKILTEIFDNINIDLVDFKIEFGRKNNGLIILADEISPDSCRLWDKASKEKYDKDRFRLDLGGLVEYYKKLAKKLNISLDYE